MSDETTLLPCPFCGGEADNRWRYRKPGEYACYWVLCVRCGCATTAYDTEAEAIAAWNTRAEHHVYEQRITGSGSDWGEIMCDAFDSLLESACDACTFDELERFRAYIIKEAGE